MSINVYSIADTTPTSENDVIFLFSLSTEQKSQFTLCFESFSQYRKHTNTFPKQVGVGSLWARHSIESFRKALIYGTTSIQISAIIKTTKHFNYEFCSARLIVLKFLFRISRQKFDTKLNCSVGQINWPKWLFLANWFEWGNTQRCNSKCNLNLNFKFVRNLNGFPDEL